MGEQDEVEGRSISIGNLLLLKMLLDEGVGRKRLCGVVAVYKAVIFCPCAFSYSIKMESPHPTSMNITINLAIAFSFAY